MLLAPILLARSLPIHDYGVFEYAVAMASILAMVFGLGTSGAVPYLLLERGRPQYMQAFGFHSFLLGLAGALAVAAHGLHWLSATTLLVVVIVAVNVIQAIFSTVHKVHSRLVQASLLESGLFVVLFCVVVVTLALRTALTLNIVITSILIYFGYLWLREMRHFRHLRRWKSLRRRYGKVLKFGFPLIFSSALIAFLATAGRILAGRLISMESVGVYSFYFRLAGGVILIHQLLTTIFFREVYTAQARQLDRYFTSFLWLVFAAALSGYVVLPRLLASFFPLIRSARPESAAIYFLLSVQMTFWVALALTELITTRQALANYTVACLAIVSAGLVAATLLWKMRDALTLYRVAQFNMLAIFAGFILQAEILRRNGVPLRWTAVSASSILAFYYLTRPIMERLFP